MLRLLRVIRESLQHAASGVGLGFTLTSETGGVMCMKVDGWYRCYHKQLVE